MASNSGVGSQQSRLQPNQSTNRLTTPCAETRRRDECRLYPASQEAPLSALFLAVVVVPAAVVTVVVIWVASLGPMLLSRLPLVLTSYPPLIFLFLDPFLVVGSGNYLYLNYRQGNSCEMRSLWLLAGLLNAISRVYSLLFSFPPLELSIISP